MQVIQAEVMTIGLALGHLVVERFRNPHNHITVQHLNLSLRDQSSSIRQVSSL